MCAKFYYKLKKIYIYYLKKYNYINELYKDNLKIVYNKIDNENYWKCLIVKLFKYYVNEYCIRVEKLIYCFIMCNWKLKKINY